MNMRKAININVDFYLNRNATMNLVMNMNTAINPNANWSQSQQHGVLLDVDFYPSFLEAVLAQSTAGGPEGQKRCPAGLKGLRAIDPQVRKACGFSWGLSAGWQAHAKRDWEPGEFFEAHVYDAGKAASRQVLPILFKVCFGHPCYPPDSATIQDIAFRTSPR